MIPVLLLLACAARGEDAVYSDTDAAAHVGETAAIKGTATNVKVTSANMVFIDFGKFPNSTFVAVIFADNFSKFSNVAQYKGETVTIKGKIKDYKGKAEIVLNDPSQIKAEGAPDAAAAGSAAPTPAEAAAPSVATAAATPDSSGGTAAPATMVFPDGKERKIIP